ncbi:MAG TPA: BtuF-related (seleno)protein, partial [Solirubrobacteraceae bacterium]|nr:BtuF-related (seleno)protein [Solirubrobacteraceae bacterium]
AIEWFEPLCVAGLWTPQLIELAGGVDVLGLAGEPPERVGWDVLAAAAPEVVIVMPRDYDLQTAYREAEMRAGELRATGARRIVAVDGARFSRPGPGLVDGIETLAHVLHPDLFGHGAGGALELVAG